MVHRLHHENIEIAKSIKDLEIQGMIRANKIKKFKLKPHANTLPLLKLDKGCQTVHFEQNMQHLIDTFKRREQVLKETISLQEIQIQELTRINDELLENSLIDVEQEPLKTVTIKNEQIICQIQRAITEIEIKPNIKPKVEIVPNFKADEDQLSASASAEE
jgi:hypothetical protein